MLCHSPLLICVPDPGGFEHTRSEGTAALHAPDTRWPPHVLCTGSLERIVHTAPVNNY